MSPMRHIVVVPYDPAWAEAFQEEAARLGAALGDELLALHHIGSTSVPGLPAKPIIDIMPVVRDVEALEARYPAMIALGYEAKGENGIPGRRYFVRGDDWHRTHHVHAYQPDNPEVARHLDFRDFLRTHPDVAAEYARIKRAAAEQFPHDILGYMDYKDAFIQRTIRRAQVWRSRSPHKNPRRR